MVVLGLGVALMATLSESGGSRFRLFSPEGDDFGEYETVVPNWCAGERVQRCGRPGVSPLGDSSRAARSGSLRGFLDCRATDRAVIAQQKVRGDLGRSSVAARVAKGESDGKGA